MFYGQLWGTDPTPKIFPVFEAAIPLGFRSGNGVPFALTKAIVTTFYGQEVGSFISKQFGHFSDPRD